MTFDKLLGSSEAVSCTVYWSNWELRMVPGGSSHREHLSATFVKMIIIIAHSPEIILVMNRCDINKIELNW